MSILVIVVLVAVLVYLVSIYNRLVVRRNQFKNAFAQIDVQLERRYDLIPNLVETAKAYMSHERETLEAVVKARNAAQAACRAALGNPSNPSAINSLSQAEDVLSQNLSRFMMLTENYPELKAQDSMKNVMEELSNTENLVSFARQAFNDAVMFYNSFLQQFPANVVGGFFGFQEAAHLKISSSEKRDVPNVNFK